MARVEALAAWTESLRDTIAGAVGLEQAIPASVRAAAPALRPHLDALVDRLRARMPLPDALAALRRRARRPLGRHHRRRAHPQLPAARSRPARGAGRAGQVGARGARHAAAGRGRSASTRRSVQIVVGVTRGLRARPRRLQPRLRRALRQPARPGRTRRRVCAVRAAASGGCASCRGSRPPSAS